MPDTRVRRGLIGLLFAGMLAVIGTGTAHADVTKAVTVPNAAMAPFAAPEFNATGRWQLFQSNGYTVTLNVSQDQMGMLYGTVSASPDGTLGTIEAGSRVDGRNIFFIIGWAGGPGRGRYDGVLGPDRRLSGTTFDLNQPSSQATWFSPHQF